MVVHGALAKRLWCGLVWRWRPKPHPNRGVGALKSNQNQIVALAPQIKIIHGAGALKSKSNHKSDMGWRPKSKSFMALAPPNHGANHDFYLFMNRVGYLACEIIWGRALRKKETMCKFSAT